MVRDSKWVLIPSGAIGYIILSLMVPTLGWIGWFIGAAAGMMVGYFGYKPREVVAGMKIAWEKTSGSIPVVFNAIWTNVFHPAGIVLSIWACLLPVIVAIIWFLVADSLRSDHPGPEVLILFGSVGVFANTLFRMTASSRMNLIYDYPWSRYLIPKMMLTPVEASMSEDSQRNAIMVKLMNTDYRFNILSFWACCLLINLSTGVDIIRWGLVVLTLPFRFLYWLVKIIHSQERMICGAYGSAGALITWATVSPFYPEMAVVIKLVCILAAGTLSWVLGKYIGVPVIARKVLKVEPALG